MLAIDFAAVRVEEIAVHFGGVTASTEVIAVKRHTGAHASVIACKNTIANQNLAYAAYLVKLPSSSALLMGRKRASHSELASNSPPVSSRRDYQVGRLRFLSALSVAGESAG